MVPAPQQQIILITGATNGIGLDSAKFLAKASANNHIIIGARNPTKGQTVLKDLQSQNLSGSFSLLSLDQDSDDSINAAAKTLEQDFGRLDVLINNAGICPEDRDTGPPSRDIMRRTFETNVFGATILTTALIPLLRKSSAPRIINVSSTMGSISMLSNNPAAPDVPAFWGYRMSKSAMNMMTAYQHSQLKQHGIKVLSYCPGYVATDLGRDREDRVDNGVDSSETSAVGIVEIVEGERDEHVGGFVGRNGAVYDW